MDLIGIVIDLLSGLFDLRKRPADVITVIVIALLGLILLLTCAYALAA